MYIIRVKTTDTSEDHVVWVYYDEYKFTNFIIGKNECPTSYAILMSIDEFLSSNTLPVQRGDIIEIHIGDLLAYNILTKYMQIWKMNNWIMSNGKPVHYVDIIQSLYNTFMSGQVLLHCVFDKTK